MFTKEMLVGPGKKILTSEEAFTRSLRTKTLVIITSIEAKVFFFTNDHCFAYKELPDHFVPITHKFPHTVAPRSICPDGIVDTVEKYIEIYDYDSKQITSIDELVAFLNEKGY